MSLQATREPGKPVTHKDRSFYCALLEISLTRDCRRRRVLAYRYAVAPTTISNQAIEVDECQLPPAADECHPFSSHAMSLNRRTDAKARHTYSHGDVRSDRGRWVRNANARCRLFSWQIVRTERVPYSVA